jgi:hypothetical protein
MKIISEITLFLAVNNQSTQIKDKSNETSKKQSSEMY